MRSVNKIKITRTITRTMLLLLSVMLVFNMAGIMSTNVFAKTPISIEITGNGVTTPIIYTLEQLQAMEQHQYKYSCINTWPTKKWYVGKGIKLKDLLTKSGMTEDATLIRFIARDGYAVTLTVKELFQDKRYQFPNFKTGNDGDGHVPGSPAGAVEVETLIGLVSVEGSDNPSYMNNLNAPLLMLGQRAVMEQTGNLFVKYLSKIEVLTTEPPKWDAPRANPDSGTVPAGTMVTLSNKNNDDDKIYYTTDGTVPTLNSPMYNWIAKRWWSSRSGVLGTINHPIGPIHKDTIIKAVTIGPGKLPSDIVTFTYRIEGSGTPPPVVEEPKTPEKPASKNIKLTIGQAAADINGMSYTLDAAPFIDAEANRTQVPLAFIGKALGASVDWKAETRQVTITDGGKEIVLTIDSKNALVNGQTTEIDSAPKIVLPGRTFVPLAFISETLGAKVNWNPDLRQITITR